MFEAMESSARAIRAPGEYGPPGAPEMSEPLEPLEPAHSPERLATVPLELIEREIESLAAQINAGSARWLCLVAEFDRREGWGGSGCRSTAEWVAWRCALNPRSAREHVRVARALIDLPEIRTAFARGALSYSKVRALTRVAGRETEADLLRLARYATAAQLERIVRAARRTAAQADSLQREAFVRWSWDDADGCLRLDAKLAPEDGALFLRALESARDALYERRTSEPREDRGRAAAGSRVATGGSAEPPEALADRAVVPSPANAESLAALAETALAHPPTALTGGERYQVLVHVDVPPSVRRALVARDGRCQFPGCERHRFVDAHHVHHWARGGATDSQIWSWSVATITASCTRAASPSAWTPTADPCSRAPTVPRSPPPRSRPPPIPPGCLGRAGRRSRARART
jgi:hypothetical protein